MAKPKLIEHPVTGVKLTYKEWAQRNGIAFETQKDRCRKYDLITALSPEKLYVNKYAWSHEEDEYLAEVYKAPNLVKNWASVAKKRGWLTRSKGAIDKRISYLIRCGVITPRKELDESDGWLYLQQLADCLLIHVDVIRRWSRCGMPVSVGGDTKKVHLKKFVEWATLPNGAALVSKALSGNPIACNWLLVQIGNWR